jgi:hypothetical protein
MFDKFVGLLKDIVMNKLGLVLLASILVMPIAVNAQIYKWKDKDGSVRYSDTPPPGNVEYQSLGGRKPVTPAQPAEATANQDSVKPADANEQVAPSESPQQLQERQRIKEAELKLKQENCKAAQANVRTFERGGRITRINEKGELIYFDDAEIARNLEEAKRDAAQYCN